MKSLVEKAAALDDSDLGMPEAESEAPDESEDGGKADFLRMCKAIKAGDFDAAWEAYEACRDA